MDDILRNIDPEAMARDTLAFVQVTSETGAEGPGSRYFAELLSRHGFQAEMDEAAPGRPNVYARLAGSGGGRTLLFNGHTDTIPIGRSTPPGREDGWIVGRGSEDMKGGLVAMLHGISALRRSGVPLRGDVWLTGVVGHETPAGKKEGPLRLIERLRAGSMRADAIIVVEGPYAIWSASLGSTIFHVTLSSPRGIIHTIKTQFRENPARWLGWLLTEFERLEDGFRQEAAHPLCGREQINVGIVQAGDYPNRLPTPARVTGTWRWPPGRTADHVRSGLEAFCRQIRELSGLDARYDLEGTREPFETPSDHPVVEALRAAGSVVSGAPLDRIGMALVCDANLFANLAGVPTVCCGPAYETAHSDHERVSVAQLVRCAGMYALAAQRFCA